MAKRVQPGDKLRLSAREENAKLFAAEWVADHALDRGGDWRSFRAEPDVVHVKNNTGAARDVFDCVELGDVVIKSGGGAVSGLLQTVCDGNTPGYQTRHTAVLAEPIGSGGIGKAYISGLHPATVNVGNTSHRRASSAYNSHVLASDMVGPYEIINTVSGTGSQTCIVKKSNRASVKLVGMTGSGGIAAATFSTGSGGSCQDLTPGSGTVTLMLWDEQNSKYTKSSVTMTVYNIADAVGAYKGIAFSTDDDRVPSVDVESCDLECS